MSQYGKDCWEAYLAHRDPERLVKCVYGQARKAALTRGEGKNLVHRATMTLVELSQQKGADAFISLKEIQQRTGTETSRSGGLWPWLQKTGADVLEERSGPKSYRIRSGFREAIKTLFTDHS